MSKLVKTLICGGDISLAVLDTACAAREGVLRHRMAPASAKAYARAFTLTAYLCGWLKEEGNLSVTVNGGGAGGKICLTGDSDLCLRGYIEHADVSLGGGEETVCACVGKNGTLTVVRSEPYCLPFVGTSELVSGNLNDDFVRYFAISEQRDTWICAGECFSDGGELLSAGAVVLQAMPFAAEESLARARSIAENYRDIACRLQGGGAEEIARELSPEGEISAREIRFRCRCSRERAQQAVRSLRREEAEEILRAEGKISVHCHDCNTDYSFGKKEAEELFCGGE